MLLPTLCLPPAPGFPKILIKAQPEDFVVEEQPLYEPSGAGTHSYLWIEKRGLATRDAVRLIAQVLSKRAADAGAAGLKDARAVSRQWISFEHVPREGLDAIAKFSDQRLRVLKVSAHGNKLKMGHLRGNRFVIRVRVAVPDAGGMSAVRARAEEVLGVLAARGVPNYFGEQRFGREGDNASLGRMLVLGDNAGFEQEFARRNGPHRKAERKIRNLLVNAFQSELFNRVLARRIPNIGTLEAGDLAWLHRNGAVFSVATAEDAAREQPRADAFEISPSGPIFGAKSLLAGGAPGEIERAVLAEAGVELAHFGRREAERQPGARRPLRIPFLEAPRVEDDPAGIVVYFALPPGAYATVVLREIFPD